MAKFLLLFIFGLVYFGALNWNDPLIFGIGCALILLVPFNHLNT